MIEITSRVALDYQERLKQQREQREIEKQKMKDDYKKTGKIKIDTTKIQDDLKRLSIEAKESKEKTHIAIQKNLISWKYRWLTPEQKEKAMTEEEKKIMQ